MAIFKKKTKVQNLEPELDTLRQRAEALDVKRCAADAELTSATEARQRHLVEGDLDDAKTAQLLQDEVNVAASQVVALEDAITVVQAQIADIEQKLDAERIAAERKTASEKLAHDLDAVEKALPNCLEAGRRFAAALGELHHNFEATQMATFLASALSQVEIASASAVTELRGTVRGIADGTMPIPAAKPVPAPVVATALPLPTRALFAMHDLRWLDDDGRRRVSGQFEDVVLPIRLADKALRFGACVPLTDDRRKKNKDAHGGRHPDPASPHIWDLDDIEARSSGTLYVGPGNDAVLAAANMTVREGPAITGTITVGRV
jgi:hypothetical protein